MAVRRPNILLLMTDQQRYDSLGCYGVPFAHTPNLDRLAAQGAVFDQCYVNNPICTPSRACLFTGKHVQGHGVNRLHDDLADDEVLFPEYLRREGYRTALFGKLHVSSQQAEVTRRHPHDGFDVFELCHEGCMQMDAPMQAYARWLESCDMDFYQRLKQQGRGLKHPPRERHMTYWAAERTIDFLHDQAADPAKPFFCAMSIFEPHNPYEHYPQEMGQLVDAAAIPPPVDAVDTDEPAGIMRERRGSYMGDIATMPQEAIAKMRHGYHASVAYSDLEFGRVLDVLDETGLAENTLVIFTSDHGDMIGDHGLLAKGAFFFEANVRVPLIMRWPGVIPAGSRASALVQLHDLAATVIAAAGCANADWQDRMPESKSLLPLATGDTAHVRDEAVCCYRNSGIQYGGQYWDPPIHATMFRAGPYKLNAWHDGAGEGELYNLERDPVEQHNLWHDQEHRKTRDEFIVRLKVWLAAHGEAEEFLCTTQH